MPIKLLFPLLEGASLEENEDLHTMWAALLANAAATDDTNRVRPGFIASLRQLSPDEALILTYIYDHASEFSNDVEFERAIPASELLEPYASWGFDEIKRRPDGSVESIECDTRKLGTCLDSLVAEQLIARG